MTSGCSEMSSRGISCLSPFTHSKSTCGKNEHVRMDRTHPQYDFTLRTHSLDSTYTHPTAEYDFGELKGGLGLQGGFQEMYTGLPPIPNFRAFSGGLFGMSDCPCLGSM